MFYGMFYFKRFSQLYFSKNWTDMEFPGDTFLISHVKNNILWIKNILKPFQNWKSFEKKAKILACCGP